MTRVFCDRCGLPLHLEGAQWDTTAPPVVRAGVESRGVDLCFRCAEIIYTDATHYVASQGGYRTI